MTSPTLAPPDVTTELETEPSGPDGLAHYVRHQDVIAATFDGALATALCGKRWDAKRSPRGLPVCPVCQELYGLLDGPGAGE